MTVEADISNSTTRKMQLEATEVVAVYPANAIDVLGSAGAGAGDAMGPGGRLPRNVG